MTILSSGGPDRRCTWCGCVDATKRTVDAGGAVHWFHVGCWRVYAQWMQARPGRRA